MKKKFGWYTLEKIRSIDNTKAYIVYTDQNDEASFPTLEKAKEYLLRPLTNRLLILKRAIEDVGKLTEKDFKGKTSENSSLLRKHFKEESK